MKNVLLILDDQKELNFIRHNLSESGFNVSHSESLDDGLIKAAEDKPDLIVVNTSDTPKDVYHFSRQLKSKQLNELLLLCLIELDDYLFLPGKEHFIIKPVRPKLLLSLIRGIMNKEEINWLLAVH